MTNEPSSPAQVLYQEKLWPAWWLWVAAAIIGASFSTTFFPISAFYGVLALVIGVALCVGALVATTPRLEITPEQLRVGRARIPLDQLGHIVGHTGDAAREQLGPGFDARSYQCVRGWIPSVITAEVADPQDPTPYWLFSTRSPSKVLDALGSTEPVRSAGVSVSEPT